MATVTPTWSLMITVFFVVIMAYSFIVGRNKTVEITISTYIAMLAANGLAELTEKYIELKPLFGFLGVTEDENTMIFKIFLFILITLILVLKGSFYVDLGHEHSLLMRLATTTLFGFLSAGLIISTILVFMTGADGVISSSAPVLDIPNANRLVDALITYHNFWFAAPAVVFIALSLLKNIHMPVVTDEE